MKQLLIFSGLIVLTIQVIIAVFWTVRGTAFSWKRMLVRTAVLCGISVAAVFIANLLAKVLTGPVLNYLHGIEIFNSLSENSETLDPFVAKLAGAIIAPFIFAILFEIARLATMGIKKKADGSQKLAGAAAGLVYGLVVAFAVLLPFNYAVKIAADAKGEVFGLEENRHIIATPVSDVSGKVASALLSSSVDVSVETKKLAVRTLLANENVIRISISPAEDIPMLIDCAYDAYSAYQEAPKGKTNTFAMIAAVNAALPYIKDSQSLSQISSEIIVSAAESWKNGDDFMGVEFPLASDNDKVEAFANALLSTLGNTTSETSSANIETFVSALTIALNLDENAENAADILLDTAKLKDADLAGALVDFTSVIAANEEFGEVVAVIGSIGSELIEKSDVMPLNQEDIEAYKALLAEFNDILHSDKYPTHDDKVDYIASRIADIVKDYGYTIGASDAKAVATLAVSQFGKYETVTLDDILEYFKIDPALAAQYVK